MGLHTKKDSTDKLYIEQLLYTIYIDTPYTIQWQAPFQQFWERWKHKSTYQDTADTVSCLDETLCMLICYGDSITKSDEMPLETLHTFLQSRCENLIRGVHILPYFPYTSDDGFSISDYMTVRDDLGDWQHITNIADDFVLMSDLVLNHCSTQHAWFTQFLANKEPYSEYFITADPQLDFSKVVRPRPHFILSDFETDRGVQHVWTTFSSDQVDLNYENPLLLFDMLDVLLSYVIQYRSSVIRLDAVAYLWKEIGTSCIHRKKTHLLVKLMRAVLDVFAAQSVLITETNVPHKENVSYFGEGDEAHLVYNFTLPPLLLYSVLFSSTEILQKWANSLVLEHDNTCFFNFCASHDGIGITPSYGILSDVQREALINKVKERGGKISYKATKNGETPYEMNISYVSAVIDPEQSVEQQAMSFLATQSVLLSMPGVPGIYIHSLLGSKNWQEGVENLGYNRAINREKLDVNSVNQELSNEESFRSMVFKGYLHMIEARTHNVAFHPFASFSFPVVQDGLFAVLKEYQAQKIICIVNLSNDEKIQAFPSNMFPFKSGMKDILKGDIVFLPSNSNDEVELTLEPYEVYWLCPIDTSTNEK